MKEDEEWERIENGGTGEEVSLGRGQHQQVTCLDGLLCS